MLIAPTNGDYPITAKHLSDRAVMQMVRLSGRSWWIGLYRDGRQCAEYDTLVNTVLTPFGLGSTSRWGTVDKRGLISLRLLCPNGQIAQLDAKDDYKFFQLKCAVAGADGYRTYHAHVIGQLLAADGSCACWAWEPAHQMNMDDGTRQTFPAGLIRFTDNIFAMRYRTVGRVALAPQGLRI
jgi:hypothetical protein